MGAFDRRSALMAGATLMVANSLSCETKTTSPAPATPTAPSKPSAEEDVVKTLVAIADRLVPSDESGPGVAALGGAIYFTKLIADPRMKQLKPMLSRGAVYFDGMAKKAAGMGFGQLGDDAKDELIGREVDNQQRVNGFAPAAFVRVMVALSLEAMLGDPRHGGNANQGGWNSVGGVSWAGRVASSSLPVVRGPG
jgi:Gluconate 2-dehydrogenase subunit 3